MYYLILAVIIQAVFSTEDSNGLFQAMTSSGDKVLYSVAYACINTLSWLAMYTGRKLVDAAAHKRLYLCLAVGIVFGPPSVIYPLIRIILA